MTPVAAIVATVLCYALLGMLLLSLNLVSLWRWWVKAAAVVLTLLAFLGSYFSISALLGWPAREGIPARFSLVATRIVEPDALRGMPGQIYLWVEEVDANQIVISPPRAFQVPFEPQLAFEVEKAQAVLEGGGSVLGQLDTTKAEAASEQASPRNETVTDAAAGGDDGGSGGGEGARFEGTRGSNTLIFSDMPPVPLPTKPELE